MRSRLAQVRLVPQPLVLPAPTTLDTGTRDASAVDRFLDGSEFDSSLPKARVFPAAPQCSFAPGGTGFSSAAYAIYRFSLDGYSGAASLECTWDTAPTSGEFYVAIADFSANRWRWYAATAGAPMDLGSGFTFLNASDEALVVVLLQGSQIHALDTLEFGEDAAPTAVLRPEYSFIDVNLQLNFDASASSDDGSIVKYEWDLNGDGTYEVDTGAVAQTSIAYPLAGMRMVSLRVKDDGGNSGTVSTEITVDSTGYDEVEPNNSIDNHNLLPGMSFQGWEGNLGNGGYDGGDSDYYRFTVTEPAKIIFRMDALALQALVALAVFDSTGSTTIIDNSFEYQHTSLSLRVQEPGDYILLCRAGTFDNFDYFLSAEVTYGGDYDEIEPNNSQGQANALDGAGESLIWGNVGLNGYDGGNEDWFVLNVPAGDLHYTFRLNFNYLQGMLNMELRTASDVLRSDIGTDNEHVIRYTFDSAGTYYLRVFGQSEPPIDGSDYLLRTRNNGAPAIVNLQASPDNGSIPLSVSLDASSSILPGGTTADVFRWDVNNDGYFETTTYGDPTQDCSYFLPGMNTARVEIELSNGSGGEGTVTINASGTNGEVEPNDDKDLAQAITLPLSSLFGDVGVGGNDGGTIDLYSFNVTDGDYVSFTLEYQSGISPIAVLIASHDGTDFVVLASSQDGDGYEMAEYSFGPAGTYYVAVSCAPGWPAANGYRLSGNIIDL